MSSLDRLSDFLVQLDKNEEQAAAAQAPTAEVPAAEAPASPLDALADFMARLDVETAPGAAPGYAPGEQDLTAAAAKMYENEVVLPESVGWIPREIERGFKGQRSQMAEAIATPGMRSMLLESIYNGLWSLGELLNTNPAADLGSVPQTSPEIKKEVTSKAALETSMAIERAVFDNPMDPMRLREEIIAAQGAAQGTAKGQREGIGGDIARATGQSITQFVAMAPAVVLGSPVAGAAMASQLYLPGSTFTAGVLEYVDQVNRDRAQAAMEGREIPEFNMEDMRQYAATSAAINTGVELGGAAIGGKIVAKIAKGATASKIGQAALKPLIDRGMPIVERAMVSKVGSKGLQTFARLSENTLEFRNGFFGKALAMGTTSGLEEGGEELVTAALMAPFTSAPLSEDIANGLYSSMIGVAAGGVGGTAPIGAFAVRQGIVNRADAMRAETDRERVLRQIHSEALQRKTNWTKDLTEEQNARLSTALDSVNGMDQEQRGTFLRELGDRRVDIRNNVDNLLTQRQQLDIGLTGVRDLAENGTDEEKAAAKDQETQILGQIEALDEQLRLAASDAMMADAQYSAVAEKIGEMPATIDQAQPEQVLTDVSTRAGVELTPVAMPKNGRRAQAQVEALGRKVVWFRPSGGKFSPAFHSMRSRGVVYMNADAPPTNVLANALEEVFHDIQMFQPELAQVFMDKAGLMPVYQAGVAYAAQGTKESAGKAQLDKAAIAQAESAVSELAGEGATVSPEVARAGAARIEQEGTANAFAAAARATGSGSILAPLQQFAARRGFLGRDVMAAMAVLDAASRAAAVETVEGTKPVATLSPLARTLLWANDMNLDFKGELDAAESFARGELEPKAAPKTQTDRGPSGATESMARAKKQVEQPSVVPSVTPETQVPSVAESEDSQNAESYAAADAADADTSAVGDDVAPSEQPPVPVDVDNAAALESVNKISRSKKWPTGRELKVVIQDGVLAAARAVGVDLSVPSVETTKYLARVGLRDALLALRQNPKAIGWYDITTRKALAVMATIHPEIATDPNARFAFIWALAVTSNGLKVDKNFQLAERVYRQYKATGVMPTNIGIGTAKKAINESLGLFNQLRDEWGMENLRRFMQTNFTVGEIAAIAKDLKPGGEHVGTLVFGSAILGPKIGNGFFSNLYGNFSSLTMDRWLIRTWGRWTGTLIKNQPNHIREATARLRNALSKLSAEQTAALSTIIETDVTTSDTSDIAIAIQKASMDAQVRKTFTDNDLLDDVRLSGNGLAKYLDGQKEAPAGPGERTFIREVFGQILSELNAMPEYANLTMADLQAVLWYAEKRLYETAKEDVSEDDIEGYSDEEAPDYANAAINVARDLGVKQTKINAAIAKEEANDGAARVQPTGTTEQAGLERKPVAPAGFSEGEKRIFAGDVSQRTARANRRTDTTGTWSYRSDRPDDGGRIRVLKSLGVRYVKMWTAGKALKHVYKRNGLETPRFVELESSDINADKFHQAITASKQANTFGAAVYVYSQDKYKTMRLFLSEDGRSGMAVTSDGDIVSVFSAKKSGAGRSIMDVAVAAGGTKLDAFETILPSFYSSHGFEVVSRLKWDDAQAPSDWDKTTFAAFNGGEPDIVFMAYNPSSSSRHIQGKSGKLFDSYDSAVELQGKKQRSGIREIKRLAKERAKTSATESMARPSDTDYLAAVERGDMATAQRMVDQAAKAANQQRVTRFTVGNRGLLNNQVLNYDKLSDDEMAEVEVLLPLGLQQPRDVPANATFFFTDEGLIQQNRLIELLKKAAKGRVIETTAYVPNDPVWTSNDGQVAVVPEQIKSADPVTYDEQGNIIPLSQRFDASRDDISYARPAEDPEVTALRQQIADLTRQMRDVQNTTAAQRVNALREVRILERKLSAAQLLAEQKVGQAARSAARLEIQKQVNRDAKQAAEEAAATMSNDLESARATVASLRQQLREAKSNADTEDLLREAEKKLDRVANWSYAIGRNEGLVAGQVAGMQQERREQLRVIKPLKERLPLVEARLAKATEDLRAARKQIAQDERSAQKAVDFAYQLGLRSGQVQGMMRGRQVLLRKMAQREDTLQRQLTGLRDLMATKVTNLESLRAAISQIATDAARTLPVRLRGPLAVRIANAKTLGQANRIAVEATKLAINEEVSSTLKTIARLKKQMNKRGMKYDTRVQIETLLRDADAALRQANRRRIYASVGVMKNAAGRSMGAAILNAVNVYSQVADAAAKVDAALVLYTNDAAAFKAEKQARVAKYQADTAALVANMQGRPTLPMRDRTDQPVRTSLARRIRVANSDIYTLQLELEGKSDGIINKLLTAAQQGKGASALEHAAIIRQLEPLLQAAGYTGLDDYALKNGMLGQTIVNPVTVTLGGRNVTIPVGTMLSIAAMDDETLNVFPKAGEPLTQGIRFPGSRTTTTIYPTREEIIALKASLTPGQQAFIDGMKSILETQIRDRTMDAIWKIEGDQPPIVQNYWPRIRDMAGFEGESAGVLNQAGALVRGALTSVGFANARTGGNRPFLYSDAFQTWDRHIQVALDMIHMAQPYRDAATVLSDQNVVELIDRQMGPGTANAVLSIFSNGVGATARTNATIIDKLTNNVTGAVLSLSPRTWAKVQTGGIIRLASEVGPVYLAEGTAKTTAMLRSPQMWQARVEQVHSQSGYFTHRHQMNMRSIMSGTMSEQDRIKVMTAAKAVYKSIAAATDSSRAANYTDTLNSLGNAQDNANIVLSSLIDVLRAIDENIMLTAVEARLSEAKDEGYVGAAAFTVAVERAEQDFRRSQNSSDEFDETAFAAETRTSNKSPAWRMLFPFVSDTLKARNQIRRAWLSGERRAGTALAIGGNLTTNAVINAASVMTLLYMAKTISSALGGDDEPTDEEDKAFDKAVKELPVNVASELTGQVGGYVGIALQGVITAAMYRRAPMQALITRPLEQATREVGKISGEDGSWAYLAPAILAVAQLRGVPAYQLYAFVAKQIPEAEKTPKEKLQKRLESIQERFSPEEIRKRVLQRAKNAGRVSIPLP